MCIRDRHKGSNLLMTRLKNIKAKEKKYVWSNGGEEFVREVSNYMKYAVATEAIDKVINISANKSDDHSHSNISGNNSNSNSNKINGTGDVYKRQEEGKTEEDIIEKS